MTLVLSAGGGRDRVVELGLVEQRHQAVLEVLGEASVTRGGGPLRGDPPERSTSRVSARRRSDQLVLRVPQ